jgi:phosphatidylserine/phosphatidylglycerophosphate/cardiolipin synthase-like enzyme
VLHEALRYAMKERGATVKIVMDSAQDIAQSRTNALAADGAEVRFLVGLRYPGSAGIMHSKMVIVDDRVVFAGSNNFSSSGLITNEENSVVLRAPRHLARVQGFTCQFERMFEAGVAPGQTQPATTNRAGGPPSSPSTPARPTSSSSRRPAR